MKKVKLFEQFIAEKREDVGKYNTVKKVVAKLGKRPSEQDLAQFINDNYYDVTEVELGDDDERANDKIADLVGFYKFDIDDWENAWEDAQNESVVTEAKFKAGDKWQWKTKSGSKVIKIIRVESNGDIIAKEDGKSQKFIVRDADKYLTKIITEAKFVKDFNRDVLDAKTKEEVLELYPNAQFFIGKSDHFFGEFDENLFFKAYYTKGQKEFEIKSVYSEKGSNYVHLYNESVVTEGISKDRMIKQIKRALKDGTAIFKLPMDTQNYYRKNKGDFESVVTEAVSRATKIYQIATPAPKAMLVGELEDLFGDDYRHIVTEFEDDERYESVLVFNLTPRDIKRIQEEIGDVLIWEYSIKKGKEISESAMIEALSKSDRKAIAYTMAEQDPEKVKELQDAIGQDFSDNYSSTSRSVLVDVKKKGGKWVAITKETESKYNSKKPKKGEREATIGITWNAMFF